MLTEAALGGDRKVIAGDRKVIDGDRKVIDGDIYWLTTTRVDG